MLISIEIMLLAITFLILVSSLSFDDILGQINAMHYMDTYIFGVQLDLMTRIMYLALIILPLLGSIVFGFLGRKIEVSRAQLTYASIILFVYVMHFYLNVNMTYYLSIDIIIIFNIVLLIGAIAGLTLIIINVESKIYRFLQAISLIIIGIYLLVITIPLGYCSTPLLLCLWIGAITTVFSCLIKLYNKTTKTKPIKVYTVILMLSIYMDFQTLTEIIINLNNIFLLIFSGLTLYTLYLLTTNKSDKNSLTLYKKFCKLLDFLCKNPPLFILLTINCFFISNIIIKLYLSLIFFSGKTVFTYIIIIMPLWLPSYYIIHLVGQIVLLYWIFLPLNVYGLALPLDLSFTHAKSQINVENATFLIINICLVFHILNMVLFFSNLEVILSKCSVNYVFYPDLCIGDKTKVSDGQITLEGHSVLAPKFGNTLSENCLKANGYSYNRTTQLLSYSGNWEQDKKYLSALNISYEDYIYTYLNNCIPLTQARTQSTNWITKFKDFHEAGSSFSEMNMEPFLDYYKRFQPVCLQMDEVLNYPNDESKVKSLIGTILNNYYKPSIYSVASEQKTGEGVIDYWIRSKEGNRLITKICVELKAADGDSWTSLLKQLKNYAEKDMAATTSFLIATKGIEIAFFVYLQDLHSDASFSLKHEDYNGLLGLYVDKEGVKVVPQKNNFCPQVRIFNLDDESKVHKYSIHALFKFMSHLSEPPLVDPLENLKIKSSISPQKLSTSVLGLGLKIDYEGRLIKGNFSEFTNLQDKVDKFL